jgi:hypothetical protein
MATIKETLHSAGQSQDQRLERNGDQTNRRPIPTAALSGLVGAEILSVGTFRSHRDSTDLDDERDGSPMLRILLPDGEEVRCVIACIDGALDVSYALCSRRTL